MDYHALLDDVSAACLRAGEAILWCVHQHEKRIDRVGHRHEWQLGLLPDEAFVVLAPGRRVDHLGSVVARASAGHRGRRNEARKTNAAKVHA